MKKLEFWLLKVLLKRFCQSDLDQWERWTMDTKHGPVFIEITRTSDGYKYDTI